MEPIWLGEYDTRQEAGDVYWIGAYYYNRWDRFNDDVLSWYQENLLPLALDLSVEEKREEVRSRAEAYLSQRRRNQVQEGFNAEPRQRAGYVDPEIIPWTVEGGGPSPIDDILQISLPLCGELNSLLGGFQSGGLQPADSAGIGLGQSDDVGITTDDYCVLEWSIQTGEAFGEGVGSEGLNLPRTYQDTNACQQLVIQELQQSRGSAVVLDCEGAAAEVGATRQDEPDQEHSAPRESANHTQEQLQELLPISAQEQLVELRFSNKMQSTFQELLEQGWGFQMQLLDSTTTYTVAFSKCEGRKRPKLTGSNCLAFKEINEQGFRITLTPVSHASTQDATGRPQSGSSSQDLCSNCNARRFDFPR